MAIQQFYIQISEPELSTATFHLLKMNALTLQSLENIEAQNSGNGNCGWPLSITFKPLSKPAAGAVIKATPKVLRPPTG